jgi:hypothetical protein
MRSKIGVLKIDVSDVTSKDKLILNIAKQMGLPFLVPTKAIGMPWANM